MKKTRYVWIETGVVGFKTRKSCLKSIVNVREEKKDDSPGILIKQSQTREKGKIVVIIYGSENGRLHMQKLLVPSWSRVDLAVASGRPRGHLTNHTHFLTKRGLI